MDDGHIIARLLEDTVAKYPDFGNSTKTGTRLPDPF